jgi:hypothetical protein
MDRQVLVSTIAAVAVVVNTEVHLASIVMDTALVVVKVRREALPARHISIAVALVAVSIRKGVAALVVRVKKGIVQALAILRKSPTAHLHRPKTNTDLLWDSFSWLLTCPLRMDSPIWFDTAVWSPLSLFLALMSATGNKQLTFDICAC